MHVETIYYFNLLFTYNIFVILSVFFKYCFIVILNLFKFVIIKYLYKLYETGSDFLNRYSLIPENHVEPFSFESIITSVFLLFPS